MQRFANAVAAYTDVADRLSAARKAAEAGKPLPSPKEVGLELLELGVRRTLASKIIPTPLQVVTAPTAASDASPAGPDAAWEDPAATHRLGLVVEAGPADRTELPVELDLGLPAGLAGKPVRAFRLVEGEKPREIPAQLDPTDTPEKARLTLLLDGAIPKGGKATVHVYLGVPQPPRPPLAPPAGGGMGGAAATSDGAKGVKWLENDKVRLLLGPEGAHLYRWEAKALGSRDLTVPGETDWSGFADVGGTHRNPINTLKCLARGPALVRYECIDPEGLVKTISLFAGASWAEVTLNAPVGYFWAFDDPRNFAADGPTPGTYLFSTGATGPVGKQADGVEAQVKAGGAQWSAKFLPGRMALAMVTPEVATQHVIAPGSGAGGVGIEGGPPASHFIIYGGALEGEPAALVKRLQQTLDFRSQPEVSVFGVQVHPSPRGV